MKHCYHVDANGQMLMSHPPMHPIKCCLCGHSAHQTWRAVREEGHGPHVMTGREWLISGDTPDSECPA